MRRLLLRVQPQIVAGLLVFLLAFGLFAASTAPLTGYEDETAAVTEGLVLKGHFWEVEGSPLQAQGIRGKGGHLYARTGLLQPLLEAPFYAVGHFLDSHVEPAGAAPYRQTFLWFHNPLVAALAAVALFGLVFITRRSIAWASALAILFVVASIAWPYSKIGMDTTFMFTILAAFALGAWARIRPTPLPWALTGFAAGAAAATKGYAVLSLISIAVLLWPTFASLDSRQRLRLLVAVGLPVLAWGIAIGWYNTSRFGSPTDFGYSDFALTMSMPLNVLGLLFSPGKGLIFYSPLVVLGALGVPRLWRADRSLMLALLVLLATLTCVSGASAYWGDEVWGPRYIVPAAWTLLVPIAWWADSQVRRRILTGLASLAFVVQLIAVSGQYSYYMAVVQKLTGVQVYGSRFGIDPNRIPYGDDPPRWIPQLSPLLLQAEGLVSSQIVEPLGGSGLDVTYDPFEGRSRTLNLSDPKVRLYLDFWWNGAGIGRRLVALLMLIVSLTSGAALYALSKGGNLIPARKGPVASQEESR